MYFSWKHNFKSLTEVKELVDKIVQGYEDAYGTRRKRIGKIWDKIKIFMGCKTEAYKIRKLREQIFNKIDVIQLEKNNKSSANILINVALDYRMEDDGVLTK